MEKQKESVPVPMPLVGLGTGTVTPMSREELRDGISRALEVGYRLFDTAYVYQNEDVLGQVLKEWMQAGKLRRSEFFVITKLPPMGMEKCRVEQFLKLSLAALELEYVDLYLVHFPLGVPYTGNHMDLFPRATDGRFLVDLSTNLEEVWKGMEAEVDKGRAKAIGISNFNIKQVKRILASARIPPATIEIETHLFCQQQEMRRFCAEEQINVCAYAPLGSPGRNAQFQESGKVSPFPSLLEEESVASMALKYGKAPSQVLLRFLTQERMTVIPKSTHPERLRKNFEILDFELKEEEMETLRLLDKGGKGRMFSMNNFVGFEDHPEFPFN